MKINFFWLIIYLVSWNLIFPNSIIAQNKMLLYGKVKEGNNNLEGAIITVKKGSQRVKSSSTPKSGKFEFEINYDEEYIINFSKRGYVAKNISISTKISMENLQAGDKEFTFKVDLFKQPKDEIVEFKQPVAKVTYNDITDYFDYDLNYTKSIQSLLKEIKEVQKRVEKEASEEAKTAVKTKTGGGSTTVRGNAKTREEIEAEWAKVREEEKRKREEEARRKEEERRKYEEARKKAQEEAQIKATEEAVRKEEERINAEKARRKAQEETREKAEEERIKKEQGRKILEEARKISQQEAQETARKREEKRKKNEEARRVAREEAQKHAREKAAKDQAMQQAVTDSRRKAQEEARRRSEAEEKRQESERRIVEESRREMEAIRKRALLESDATENVMDRSYIRKHYKERQIVAYPYLREADVFWEKRVWRVIDVNEKMNLPFKYPRMPFVKIILDAAYAGELPVYSPIDDEFTTLMTPQEVKQIGRGVDTVLVIDPITLEETYEIQEKELNFDHIKGFRLKEDWIFDKQLSTLIIRIIGIAPIIEKYDENGNYVTDILMFWVYYPDLRYKIVNVEAYNLGNNDGARLTWYDILEMRLFSSYIVKENNPHDRFIRDYATGLDALLESDRIKFDIFKFEHDLWSY